MSPLTIGVTGQPHQRLDSPNADGDRALSEIAQAALHDGKPM